MASRGDAPIFEKHGESISRGRTHYVEVPRGHAALDYGGKDEIADTCECLTVESSSVSALLVPLVEQRELVLQDDRLDRVEARRPSQARMYVLRGLAVLAEAADSSSQLRVGGHERPGPRKPRLNADARLTLARAFASCRALTRAAEMADFGAIDWT